MRGTVISEFKKYEFDEEYEMFDINLPHISKKENKIHVLMPSIYPYKPNIGDNVQITGTLVTYDEGKAGLQTYILIIALYKCSMEDFDLEENNINIMGRVFKKDKLCKTSKGVLVQRISISTNTRNRYKPVHCVGYQNCAEALDSLNKNDMVEVSGKLISREFLYRENHRRETTELIVNYVYPIRKSADTLADYKINPTNMEMVY